jgi:hypothetical protein
MTQLEKEVERLKIKLETLVQYLNARAHLGPPWGRADYDARVEEALRRAGLQ